MTIESTKMPTASWTDFHDVTIPLDADDRSGPLYFTFRGRDGFNPRDLFDLIMGLNRWAKGILSVPIDIYRGLPPLAYLPLLIIWLGIGEASKILLLSLSAFAPICYAAQAGVRSVPQERINAARSLGASASQIFVTIVLPSALPEILTGLRIAIGASLSTLVAAELIAAQSGLAFALGGTSLLIVVNVTMDTVSQIQSHLIAHQYGDLIKKAKLKTTPRRR